MRMALWTFAATLVVWAQPGRADITAIYALSGPRALGSTLIVEVADNGDARITADDGQTVAIRRDGTLYLARRDENGPFMVPSDEFARIEESKAREADGLPGLVELPPVRIEECGTEIVGGRRGVVLALLEQEETVCDPSFAFVVNSDADLAPVGPLVAAIVGGFGADAGFPLADQLREVFARGTLIRSFMLRLESTSDAAIPASAFELPGPVVSGAEAEARLGPAW